VLDGEGVICGPDGKSGSRSMHCAPSWNGSDLYPTTE
jgi:hypothetical protein